MNRTLPLLIAFLLLSGSASALTQITVADTSTTDINTAFPAPLDETYQFTFNNPPFSFNSNASNISAFFIEGKQYWGDIPRSSPVRLSIWNYSISNATETHYIEFENHVDQTVGIWFTHILVKIDGVVTYQLDESYSTFHPWGFDYRTSFIVGMGKNRTLQSWTPGNSGTIGTGDLFCPSVLNIGGGCGPRPDLATTTVTSAFNYSSAVYVADPGRGGSSVSPRQGATGLASRAQTGGYFAFNLTNPNAISVSTQFVIGSPNEIGFVYAFVQGYDSVSDANKDSQTACGGFFTGLMQTFFGFCPSVVGFGDYVASFIAGFISFPLRLIGDESETASNIASGISTLVRNIVGVYTFGLSLILTNPIQLSIVVVGLGSSYSALLGALLGDPRIAWRGSFLTIKGFGIVVIAFFVILFYLVKALVWLITKFIELIVAGIGLARSFFKLV